MRYLMTFSYDGSKFYGYQKQPDKPSVQENIELALTTINSNNFVSISASGRTDNGVHALNQKAHFDLDRDINIDILRNSLNKLTSKYIYIKDIKTVTDDFHARFNVIRKKYTYKINLGEYNPIESDYIYQYNKNIDIKKMNIAIKKFEGKHNFKSFTKPNPEISDYEREIFETSIVLKDNILSISFIGSGFMRYMVRNIVGCLIEIGENKRNIDDIDRLFKCEDRKEAGIKAEACGLYLEDVFYF